MLVSKVSAHHHRLTRNHHRLNAQEGVGGRRYDFFFCSTVVNYSQPSFLKAFASSQWPSSFRQSGRTKVCRFHLSLRLSNTKHYNPRKRAFTLVFEGICPLTSVKTSIHAHFEVTRSSMGVRRYLFFSAPLTPPPPPLTSISVPGGGTTPPSP
jgi:hypothetical protein